MTYKLAFLEEALKEWEKLAPPIRQQFSKKLKERLEHPRVPHDALRGMPECYKIKLRALGYRLVYRLYEDRLVVQVVTVGKRDKSIVYRKAQQRIS